MNTYKHPGQRLGKVFLVLLAVLLALQTLGATGPVMASTNHVQAGNQQALSCNFPAPSTTTNNTYCDLQIVLMIDNSGSMRTNDHSYERDQNALDWLDVLAKDYYLAAVAAQQSSPDLHVPDVQVAIIHFSNRVMIDPPLRIAPHWIRINPANLTEWETQRGELAREVNQNQKFEYSLQPTLFSKPLEAAKRLWTLSEVQEKGQNCVRQSIVFFTDGTPEDAAGRYAGNRLSSEMAKIEAAAAKPPQLDGVYVVGFDSTKAYQNEAVNTSWQAVIDKVSASQKKIPRFILRSSEQFSNNLGEIKKYLSEVNQSESTTASWEEQNMLVSFESELTQLPLNLPSDIKFKIVTSGLQPGSTVKLQEVSVIPADQQGALPLTQSGDVYQFSWTPTSAGETQFHVAATFVNDKGATAVCSGDVALAVDVTATPDTITPISTTITPTPDTVTLTPDSITLTPVVVAPAALSLIVLPPRQPVCNTQSQPITLPMRLNSEPLKVDFSPGLTNPKWSITAQARAGGKDLGKPFTPEIKPVNPDKGEYSLVINPIKEADEIEVRVGALVQVNGQPITIPDASGVVTISTPNCPNPVPVACDCNSGLWGFWFWPLLIVLLGLMILLLVFRAGSRRDEPENPRANRDIFRRRDWHLLFWPLPVLLILLLLVRLRQWCCIIPPWLFLVGLLIWMIMVLLLRFLPGHNTPRQRAWWLLLLLLALVFLEFLTFTNPLLSLLWLLVALLSTWVIVWYISPYEPLVVPPIQFNLEIGASSQLSDGSMMIPLQVSYDERDGEKAPSEWTVRKWHVTATPPGRDLSEEVVRDDEYGRKASVTLSVMEDINSVSVQVSADVEAEGRLIRTPQATATILVVSTGGSEPPDDLKELEGIEKGVERLLNEEGEIFTFRKLAMTTSADLEALLHEKPWGKMMDPKTWPQQAKLADIAKRYGNPADKQNYEAYKAWLKDGIEPDEHNNPEKPRRPVALLWNGIPQFTPIVLRIPLAASSVHSREAIILPMQLDHNAKEDWLWDIEWKVSAKAMPGGADVETTLHTLNAARGEYELVINPVSINGEMSVEEILVTVQARVNGRSIEIYNESVTVQIAPLPAPDHLEDLEGIGKAVAEMLNDNGIFTFRQLAKADIKEIKAWLDDCGYEYLDPKTWPQQAKLADIARDYGRAEDQQSYRAYKAWLKNGIEPDEAEETPEHGRRTVALVWYGTAERTEAIYSEIFRK